MERNVSKFDYDSFLFKPEPPLDVKHVRKLFCGRDKELERGVNTLRSNLDLGGKVYRNGGKRPWVIHGESRSGKSHLARRIFAQFPSNQNRIQCLIPSGGRLNALAVMRDIFETLRGEFQVRVLSTELPDSPVTRPIISLTRQMIDKIALFERDVQTATLTVENSDAHLMELGLNVEAPMLLKFLAKFQAKRSEKNAVQVSLRPPTPIDLAQVCGVMMETLLTANLVKHALVLVDDADLLEAYITPEQNAREQRSLLADALDALHNTPGVDVVLTARSWYAHSRKELQTLVDLARSEPLSVNALLGIHDRRFQLYGGKGWPSSFLTESALQQLAEDTERLPGVFLQHLNSAFYEFQNEEGWDQRNYSWLLDVFRSHIDSFREKCGPAFAAIEESLKNGSPNVDVSQSNPFFGTVIDNEFVYQSYYSETTYFMSGVLRKLIDQRADRIRL